MTLVVTGDNNTHQMDDGEGLGTIGTKDVLNDTVNPKGEFYSLELKFIESNLNH